MSINRKQMGWTAAGIKRLAMVCMVLDHLAAFVLLRSIQMDHLPMAFSLSADSRVILYHVLRVIGRVAFPVFAFFLVEGFYHSKNRWKYWQRLAVFALLSEVPYDMVHAAYELQFPYVTWEKQNTLVTLALGLLALMIMDQLRYRWTDIRVQLMVVAGVALAFGLVAEYGLRCDYGMAGIFCITLIYWNKKRPLLGLLEANIVLVLMINKIQLGGFLALLPLSQYSGARGMQSRYGGYLFYPLHLVTILLLCLWEGLLLF